MATPQSLVDLALAIPPARVTLHPGNDQGPPIYDALLLRKEMEAQLAVPLFWEDWLFCRVQWARKEMEAQLAVPLFWEDWLFCRVQWARKNNAYVTDLTSLEKLDLHTRVAKALNHSSLLVEIIGAV
jgi:hypothetical protein